ncbi:outer membrane beta-barrel protein [Povalibacter sp.]|uniref:outer membrane beta-barrel protein n=1 Tax=Povalibacter sp. TaxID=1962978 RepID=UPI002F3FDD7D
MKQVLVTLTSLAAGVLASATASAERGTGWEFGADVIYQLSQDLDFNGGSSASLDDDFGLAIAFGYRISDKLEVQFALDWNDVDYDATLQTASDGNPPVPLGTVGVSGSYEAFTPRASLHYNFIDGPVTPYVKAGIGWAFIDTNIPDGRPQNVCWWDPWWGYICGTVQDTRSIDGFEYEVGVGVRWDLSAGYSLRAAYERHWLDLSEADGTPDLDQFKIGIVYRY